jgi:hypothetical protein
MRRIVPFAFILAIALGLMVDFAPDVVSGLRRQVAEAHDGNTIFYNCTGYTTEAVHTTAAGNLYESRQQTCLTLVSFSNTVTTWETVTRAKCFRNGEVYGNGNGGCRWSGYVDLQGRLGSSGDPSITFEHDDWCSTCGGLFVHDSGRKYGTHHLLESQFDWDIRAAANNTIVRFSLADGSEVVKNHNGQFTSWKDASAV